jgi:glycosyltransferase involved in cell wall biosynthesis
MKTICVVVQNVYVVDVRVRRKVEALVAAGYAVDVFALAPPGGAAHTVVNGVDVYALSLGKMRGSRARYIFEYAAFFVWALVKVTLAMRRRRYAVIDVNTLPDFLVFAAAPARWMGAKVLLDMHEITAEFYMSKYGIAADSWIVRMLHWQERASFSYADQVVTISEPVVDLLVSRGLSRAKSTVVMNAADEARFAAAPGAPARDRAAHPFVMMYHGTLTKIYGLDIAVDAFALAHAEMPGAELWILGSGTEAAPLADQVARLGLSSKVKLVGVVPANDIPRWLSQCTVGVLPIRRDVFLDFAFPNKLPEFIISDIPVIVSRLRAIRYYFSEDALAYCEPNSPEDLARQMVRVYRDPALRSRLTREATREYAAIRWEIMKARYLNVVEKMAGRSATEAASERVAGSAVVR